MAINDFQENHDGYLDWINTKPEYIKKVVFQYPPYLVYRFKESKKQCYIISYDEDEDKTVTVTVQKTGIGGVMEEMGLSYLDRNQVFGVTLDSLEPVEEETV